jgi:hypothetical protein
MITIIRKYTAFDGTQMVVYKDNTGHENTVPLWVFKKLNKNK